MKRLAILALCYVAGCSGTPAPSSDDISIGLRNPTVPLGGTSRFDTERFTGTWQTVDCLGRCAAIAQYVRATDGVIFRQADGTGTAYTLSAPGILRATAGDHTLVVMWVDEGFRTAAIGDADGRWAAIIDRTRTSSSDRRRAAIEILDFNGWDVSQIKRVE